MCRSLSCKQTAAPLSDLKLELCEPWWLNPQGISLQQQAQERRAQTWWEFSPQAALAAEAGFVSALSSVRLQPLIAWESRRYRSLGRRRRRVLSKRAGLSLSPLPLLVKIYCVFLYPFKGYIHLCLNFAVHLRTHIQYYKVYMYLLIHNQQGSNLAYQCQSKFDSNRKYVRVNITLLLTNTGTMLFDSVARV